MEDYIDIATTVDQLISILSTKVPRDATIEQAEGARSPDVEVWYDKDTNTVILK
jgi:hypothetical protein